MEIEQVSKTSDELVAAFEHLTPQLSPGHLPPTRAELDALLAQPGCSLLLARQAGQICGVLTLIIFRTPMAVHAWIEDVVVDAEFRGQGIGEALTRRAIDLAQRTRRRAISTSPHAPPAKRPTVSTSAWDFNAGRQTFTASYYENPEFCILP